VTLVLVLGLVVLCVVTTEVRVTKAVRSVGDEILLAMKEKV
jgi:hypothetical protein